MFVIRSDGLYTYTFNHANQLVGVSGAGTTLSYGYNGQGDRVSQTVGITTTNYTLDLAAGLTQVLSDGTDTYLYGNGRIAQYDTSGAQYFLGDALGSVRQLVDANGEVLLAQSYQPYGSVLESVGDGESSYGFAAEMQDSPTGLIYLRARFYSSSQGRFISRDTWPGDYNRPLSLNGWNYVEANPINATDPSGRCLDADMDGKCDPGWQCIRISDPIAREQCLRTHCVDYALTPTPICDSNCINEATKPLKTWNDISRFKDPSKSVSARLLLAEIGWRIIANANWEQEGIAILWTVKNRVLWEEQRLRGDPEKVSIFHDCSGGFVPCVLAGGQNATTTTTRGLDPLFLDPDEPGMRRSYYHSLEYVNIAVQRATTIATKVHLMDVPDPTKVFRSGGAHYFSHVTGDTTFAAQVDFTNGKFDPHHELIWILPYIETVP